MPIKHFVFASLALAALLDSHVFAAMPKHNSHAFVVGAYVPDYRIAGIKESQLGGLTDLYYFSAMPTFNGTLDTTVLQKVGFAKLVQIRQWTRSRHIRLWLTVGGASRSDGFFPVAASPALRAKFVQELAEFLAQYKLDGVDYDWEQPVKESDIANYTQLIADTEKVLRPRGWKTAATIIAEPNLAAGVANADEVHVMAYDHDGKHSTLASAASDAAIVVHAGVDANKIVLGIPFYGRDIRHFDIDMTYETIVRQYNPPASSDQVGQMYFNGRNTVSAKVKLAKNKGYAGVMAWELGQDTTDTTSLTRAMAAAARYAPVSPH